MYLSIQSWADVVNQFVTISTVFSSEYLMKTKKHVYECFKLRYFLKTFTTQFFCFATGLQCLTDPKAPANGRLKCSSGFCHVSCIADHKFPNGETTMTLGCMNGRWIVKNFDLNEVPACERNYSNHRRYMQP